MRFSTLSFEKHSNCVFIKLEIHSIEVIIFQSWIQIYIIMWESEKMKQFRSSVKKFYLLLCKRYDSSEDRKYRAHQLSKNIIKNSRSQVPPLILWEIEVFYLRGYSETTSTWLNFYTPCRFYSLKSFLHKLMYLVKMTSWLMVTRPTPAPCLST